MASESSTAPRWTRTRATGPAAAPDGDSTRRTREPSSPLRRRGARRRTPLDDHRALPGQGRNVRGGPGAQRPARRCGDERPGPAHRLLDEPLLALDPVLLPPRLPRLRPLRRGPALRVPRGQRGDGLRRRHAPSSATPPTGSSTTAAPRSAWPEGVKRTEEAIRASATRTPTPTCASTRRTPRPQAGLRGTPVHRCAAVGRARPVGGDALAGRVLQPVHQFMSPTPARLRLLRVRRAAHAVHARGDRRPPAATGTTSSACRVWSTCSALTLSLEPAAIAIGGTQAITDALVAAGRRRGVEYLTHAPGRRDPHRGRSRDRRPSGLAATSSRPTSSSAVSACPRRC